jgi:hypothetical protein
MHNTSTALSPLTQTMAAQAKRDRTALVHVAAGHAGWLEVTALLPHLALMPPTSALDPGATFYTSDICI